jgi:hypothetical protein
MFYLQSIKGLKRPRFDSKQRLDDSFPIMSHFLSGPHILLSYRNQVGAAERIWDIHISIQAGVFEYVELYLHACYMF